MKLPYLRTACGVILLAFWLVGASIGKPAQGIAVGAVLCGLMVWILGA